jgi:hypothetical protein
MSHLTVLFNLHKRILINTYWRTRGQRVTTTLLLCGAIAFLAGAGYAAQRFVLAGAIAVLPGVILFSFVMLTIFSMAQGESLANLIPRFYRSPDLNYLLALPIPPNLVLAIKFLAAQLQSIRGMSFLALMLLVAVGWALGAPWYYYLLLFPVFLLYTLVPAGLGLLLGMALLRLMSAKMFVRLAGILSLVVTMGSFAMLGIIGAEEVALSLTTHIVEFFAWLGTLWAELITPVSATVFFNAIAAGEVIKAGRPLFMLILVTGVTMGGIFWLARHLFYQGWLITHSAPSGAVRVPKRRAAGRARTSAHSPWYALVVREWRFALRNGEMRMFFFGMVLTFAGLIIMLAKDIIPGVTSAAAMAILAIAAAFLFFFSIIPLFLPPEIFQSKSAASMWKNRLWLVKALPLNAWEVVFAEIFKTVVPAFLLGAAGMLVYAVISGSAFIHTIAALVRYLMLLCGLLAIQTGLEFWEFAKKPHKLLTDPLQLLTIFGFVLAAAAPLTLYLLSDIPLLTAFRIEPLFAIGLMAWPLLSFLAIGVGFRLAVRNWDEMEI